MPEIFTLHDNISENELMCRSKICRQNDKRRKNIFAVTFADDQKVFSLMCQTCGAMIVIVARNTAELNS